MPDAQLPLDPYPCAQIVYRAQLKKDWVLPNGRIRKQAFYRMNKDTDGISVSRTPENCSDGLDQDIFGKFTLHVGRVRTLNIDVIPDTPTHANIVGVPTRDEDHARALTLAEDLASMARRVD